MKWPFVSRAAYDVIETAWCQEHDHALDTQKRFDALLEHYHELKLSGAAVPEPTSTLQRPEFDPVHAAITAKAGPDRKLRAMMSREAMQSRAAGIPDDEIINAIEQGITVDMEGSL